MHKNCITNCKYILNDKKYENFTFILFTLAKNFLFISDVLV